MKRAVALLALITLFVCCAAADQTKTFDGPAIMPDFEMAMRPRPRSPDEGTKIINTFVDGFDIDLFMQGVESSGSRCVMWMMTNQVWGYFYSPNRTLDAILPGYTSRRDLTLEVARRVKASGRQFYMVLPASMGPAPYQEATISQSFAWSTLSDLGLYRKRYDAFILDYVAKFKDYLDGVIFLGKFPIQYYWKQELADQCRSACPGLEILMAQDEKGAVPASVAGYREVMGNELAKPPSPSSAFLVYLGTNPVYHAKAYTYTDEVLEKFVAATHSRDIFRIHMERRGEIIPELCEQIRRLLKPSAVHSRAPSEAVAQPPPEDPSEH